MKQGINKDLRSILQLENCFGASFASSATQIPQTPLVCVCVCVCQKRSSFRGPLPTVYLDCCAAYDDDTEQTLSKSFALLRTQTYLPDQTADLPRRTINRGTGCTPPIQKHDKNKTKEFLRSIFLCYSVIQCPKIALVCLKAQVYTFNQNHLK